MGLGMWMTSCPEAMGWGFWVVFEKKQLLEIRTWAKRVDFESGRGQVSWVYVMHIVGSDGTVSIVKIVSLSPRVGKPKSQEGNKSFVPELKKVVSVSRIAGFLCIWTVVRIRTFHASVYLYILRNHAYGYITITLIKTLNIYLIKTTNINLIKQWILT